ncbi:hypothetical protein D3C84_1153230 [compost metagenome]
MIVERIPHRHPYFKAFRRKNLSVLVVDDWHDALVRNGQDIHLCMSRYVRQNLVGDVYV